MMQKPMGRRTGTHLDGLSHLFVTVAVWALDQIASLKNPLIRIHSAAGLLLFYLFHLDFHSRRRRRRPAIAFIPNHGREVLTSEVACWQLDPPIYIRGRLRVVSTLRPAQCAARTGVTPRITSTVRAVHGCEGAAASALIATTPDFLTADLLGPAAVLAAFACRTTAPGVAAGAARALAHQGVG